jgi:hypothetical protein
MKKIISVVLFVTIVSNYLFAQDFTIRTIGYCDGRVNKITDNYSVSKYLAQVENNFQFKGDSIKVDDLGNNYYKILTRHEGLKINDPNEDELKQFLECKDKNNLSCYFFIMKDKKNNDYIIIEYSNVVYFYYTKI